MGRIIRGGTVIPAENVEADAPREGAAIPQDERLEAERLREEAVALLVEARARRVRALAGLEGEVVRLAMDVAHKIVKRELETSPELVVGFFADALRRLELAEELILRVNPHDMELVSANRRGFEELVGEARIQIVEDESVELGGCIVESDMGRIDASLETQISAIEQVLTAEDG